MQRLYVLGAFAIGLIAAVVIGVVALDADDPDPLRRRSLDELAFPALDHDPDAATELLGAWERWRTATFITSGTWTRELDDGSEPLVGPSYRVQDPPRRLVVRLGATVERIDGAVAACDADEEGFDAPGCIASEGGASYDERVAKELAVVATYVQGDDRLYDVAFGEEPGCLRAEVEIVTLVSPWGRWAEFCFDEGTGALLSSRVRRPSAVDTESLRLVSDVVTDADFPTSSPDGDPVEAGGPG
jgi:hypothetical protein